MTDARALSNDMFFLKGYLTGHPHEREEINSALLDSFDKVIDLCAEAERKPVSRGTQDRIPEPKMIKAGAIFHPGWTKPTLSQEGSDANTPLVDKRLAMPVADDQEEDETADMFNLTQNLNTSPTTNSNSEHDGEAPKKKGAWTPERRAQVSEAKKAWHAAKRAEKAGEPMKGDGRPWTEQEIRDLVMYAESSPPSSWDFIADELDRDAKQCMGKYGALKTHKQIDQYREQPEASDDEEKGDDELVGERIDKTLDESDWPTIRTMRSNGLPLPRIARSYGVELEYLERFMQLMEKNQVAAGNF